MRYLVATVSEYKSTHPAGLLTAFLQLTMIDHVSTWIVLGNRNMAVKYSENNWVRSESPTYGMTSSETCAESPGTVNITYDCASICARML